MKTERNLVRKTIYNSQLYNQKAPILHKIRELKRKLATHKKQTSHTQKNKKIPENVKCIRSIPSREKMQETWPSEAA